MKEAKHTPLPWKINGRFVDCSHGEMICEFPQSSDIGTDNEDVREMGVNEKRYQENAVFIVRACNSHYELVEKTHALFTFLDNQAGRHLDMEGVQWNRVCAELRQAIAKAEGGAV